MSATDPLLALRRAIASSQLPLLTTSSDPSDAPTHTTDDLALATNLFFSSTPAPTCIPLTTPTRFVSSDSPVDLRSIFFAWQEKDVAIADYITHTAEIDRRLEAFAKETGAESSAAKVRNLVFVERLDLITWLEGASEESEYITPLAGIDGDGAAAGQADTAAAAGKAADIASGAAGGVGVVPSAGAGEQVAAGGRPGKVLDARLQEIYNGERKLGDRNSILRGIKPTSFRQDFSHVRKTAEVFLGRHRRAHQPTRPGQQQPPSKGGPPPPSSRNPSGPTPQKPLTARTRLDPIILLSPSASSLLRLSNIKSFLGSGLFVPADHPTLASHTNTNLLQLQRHLRSLPEPSGRPHRFIVVDSPDQFKPDYWTRVVAVFTTGQTWQFKSYKWRDPVELFRHALGVYVGWEGEPVPKEVRAWGRGVVSFGVQRWDERVHRKAVEEGGEEAGRGVRWRDREVVEGIWGRVEEGMRGRGWPNVGGK
ncbi:MAG: hypothetical protein Q9227_004789 [Pyrenula ochraceoflavens]